jgi:hypothetical protein
MKDYIERRLCCIHSLDGGLDEAAIVRKIGNGKYVAMYKDKEYTAIFNPFSGRYYVDDLFGAIDKKPKERENER